MRGLVLVAYEVATAVPRLAECVLIALPVRAVSRVIKPDAGYLAAAVFVGAVFGAALCAVFGAVGGASSGGSALVAALSVVGYCAGAVSCMASFPDSTPVNRLWRPAWLTGTRAAGHVGLLLGVCPSLLVLAAPPGLAVSAVSAVAAPLVGYLLGFTVYLGSPRARQRRRPPGRPVLSRPHPDSPPL